MCARFPLLVLVLMFSLGLQAQTRKIAHRSHAGQPNTFAMLLEEDHAGAYNPPPTWESENYDLEPWVAKIRMHYEEQAKKSPKEEAATTKAPSASEQLDTIKVERAVVPIPKSQNHRSKDRRGGILPGASIDSNEDGLVTRFRLAKKPVASASVASDQAAGMFPWWLALATLVCVG